MDQRSRFYDSNKYEGPRLRRTEILGTCNTVGQDRRSCPIYRHIIFERDIFTVINLLNIEKTNLHIKTISHTIYLWNNYFDEIEFKHQKELEMDVQISNLRTNELGSRSFVSPIVNEMQKREKLIPSNFHISNEFGLYTELPKEPKAKMDRRRDILM
ncbi:hypothetical protein YC2023_111836 [Brassica napus]